MVGKPLYMGGFSFAQDRGWKQTHLMTRDLKFFRNCRKTLPNPEDLKSLLYLSGLSGQFPYLESK